MTPPPFCFESLSESHDRTAFACGHESLDRYLQTQATQDIRRRIANCFFLVEIATSRIAGYYTLSAASIPLVDLPPEVVSRLPRHPTLPAVRIGRLAVDHDYQKRRLGELMLIDAIRRTSQDSAAAFALLVDAIDDHAAAFYRCYGFLPIAGSNRTLFLPLATAHESLRKRTESLTPPAARSLPPRGSPPRHA